MGKKKTAAVAAAAGPAAAAAKATKAARRAAREERRTAKMERRRREKRMYTADMWAVPAPSHLVARLEVPKHKSKYHSYFEFAENTEKKEKKLEFKVTNNSIAPPGFKFVPIGDPTLTNACKELSRAHDAMIFIVSSSKEENSKISEHIYRTGYHFRETIVDEARDIVGETTISNTLNGVGQVEPIPESQHEINKQADGAIRDLFPRIPNTDRQMIIEHAFKKGALFHGEPTVGLQPNISLSRRVQLAVLAHIRHTHTRYDQLLKETSWMNARKAVEPVCLDVLVKWRGDEETGRDQMDEILREVVIITDSEDCDDTSEEEDSSEDDGEITSASSAGVSQSPSRTQRRSALPQNQATGCQNPVDSPRSRGKVKAKAQGHEKTQRGFRRYQAAWDEALNRQQDNSKIPAAARGSGSFEGAVNRQPLSAVASPLHDMTQHTLQTASKPRVLNATINPARDEERYYDDSSNATRQDSYYAQRRPEHVSTMYRDKVIVRPLSERLTYYQDAPQHLKTTSYSREQGPPLVVRGSPTSHGLQDMLVPSIETASSDAVIDSPGPAVRYEIYGDNDRPQDSYPRRVIERRRQSPAPHQIIVIDDDSPQVKRRRVVGEDDSGRFRPFPSRYQDLYDAAPNVNSHLLPTSPVHARDFLAHGTRLPSQSTQGLFRDVQPSLTYPAVGERIPIYDTPPDSGYFSTNSIPLRRADIRFGSNQREVSSIQGQMEFPKHYFENASKFPYARRPFNEDMRIVEHNRVIRQTDPHFSSSDPVPRPAFPVTSRVSRSSEKGHDPVVADLAFIHSFSESPLDPPLSRARDSFNLSSETSRQDFISQGHVPKHFENQSARSFTTHDPLQTRSRARYVERPMQYQEEPLQAAFYGNDRWAPERHNIDDTHPPVTREYLPQILEGNKPTYVRTVEPRRLFTVLD